MKWLGGITDSMDTSLSKHGEIVKDREAWHAAVSRVRHDLVTDQQIHMTRKKHNDHIRKISHESWQYFFFLFFLSPLVRETEAKQKKLNAPN